jgi:competence protein ComEA
MNRARRIVATLTLAALVFAAAPSFAADAQGKVNLNTASAEQLSLLPRVGPALAGRILEFREQNGSFKKPEDLMLVRGVGEKTYELMAPYLAVSGETTLKSKVRTPRNTEAQGKPKAEPQG